MNYRYSPTTRFLKKLYRVFFPVPRSPWTAGEVEDICKINLVPPERLITFFSECIAILKKVKGHNIGDYLEFGVFNGNSIGSMYLASQKTNTPLRLFGFDAFEGLPAGSEQEDDGVWKKGFYSCSFDQTKICLSRRNVPVDSITWINGWYENTLIPENLHRYNIHNLGVVFVDCDTYSSAKTVLDFVEKVMKEPFIICFDDWKLNDLDIKEMGEYKAFNEFLDNNPSLNVKEIRSYNRKSRSFLIKP